MRRPPTHSGSPALAVPNAPARPGKEEGGAALPARAPPTTQAAGISGPGARYSAPLRRQKDALSGHRLLREWRRGSQAALRGSGSRCEKGGKRNGSFGRGDAWGRERDSRNTPGLSDDGTLQTLPVLPLSSLPNPEKAAGGFPRAFPPARWGARLLRERARGRERERALLRRTRTGRPRLPPASAAAQFVWEFGTRRGEQGSQWDCLQ